MEFPLRLHITGMKAIGPGQVDHTIYYTSKLIKLILPAALRSVAGGSSRRFFDKLNKIAKNLKIFMEIDFIKYYHLIFFS